MMTAAIAIALVLFVLCALCVSMLFLILRQKRSQDEQVQMSQQVLREQGQILERGNEHLQRLERELRREMADSASRARQELTQTFTAFQQALQTQGAEATRTQNAQMDAFALQLGGLQKNLGDTLHQSIQALSESNARRMTEVRETMERQLLQLQQTNAQKLDEMRKTVDEKLQTTLETRLSESFKQVAERLEQVHKGLGEMQNLAQGVGDLKRVLGGVKSRGVFGEVQLQALLEQVLTQEQYAKNVETKPRSNQRVEFALRFPGRGEDTVWLPIDAKFPREDYERLLDAQDRADAEGAALAGKALEARVKQEARSISESYLSPPHTTDFAIMFLPTEGLYAEVLRRPGLMESLQRDWRVTISGPTTLLAILNALQMGFRTLALEKQASQVWDVLGAVKTEFARYADWVTDIRKSVEKANATLDKADMRTRQMVRALRNIEALPQERAQVLLPIDSVDEGGEETGSKDLGSKDLI
jgi:DNA recombination protein RmuC